MSWVLSSIIITEDNGGIIPLTFDTLEQVFVVIVPRAKGNKTMKKVMKFLGAVVTLLIANMSTSSNSESSVTSDEGVSEMATPLDDMIESRELYACCGNDSPTSN